MIRKVVKEYYSTQQERDERAETLCLTDNLFYQNIGKNDIGYWVRYIDKSE
jgi:hypothetical protein